MSQYRSEFLHANLARVFVVCGRDRGIDEIVKLFSECGKISHSHLARDRSNNSRGFAFVQYESAENAWKAIKRFNGFQLSDGHVLKVSIAKAAQSQHSAKQKDKKRIDFRYRSHAETNVNHYAQHPQLCLLPQSTGPQHHQHCASYYVGEAYPKPIMHDPSNRVNTVKCVHITDAAESDIVTIRSADTNESSRNQDALPENICTLQNGKNQIMSVSALVSCIIKKMLATIGQARSQKVGDWDETDPESWMIRFRSQVNNFTQLPDADFSLSASDTSGGFGDGVRDKESIKRNYGIMGDMPPEVLSSFIHSVTLDTEFNPLNPNSGRTRSSCMFPIAKQSNKRIKHGPKSNPSELRGRSGILEKLSTEDKKGYKFRRYTSEASASHVKFGGDQGLAENHYIRTQIRVPWHSKELHADGTQRENGRRDVKPPHLRHNLSVSENEAICASTLFFVASYNYTTQELNALFGAYGKVLSINRSKTFGKVKTMAYVTYAKTSEAQLVMKWFANNTKVGGSQVPALDWNGSDDGNLIFELSFAEGTQDQLKVASISRNIAHFPQSKEEALWVLIVYDPKLPDRILSSLVAHYDKLDHVDIRRNETNGESQGVAFAKFGDNETSRKAAQMLHLSSFKLDEGEKLYEIQAMIITDPAIFGTVALYSQNDREKTLEAQQCNSDEILVPNVKKEIKDELDILAVETQFAHLMRTNHSDRKSHANTLSPSYRCQAYNHDLVRYYGSQPNTCDQCIVNHAYLPAEAEFYRANRSVSAYSAAYETPSLHEQSYDTYYDPSYFSEPVSMELRTFHDTAPTVRPGSSILVFCCASLQLTTIAALVQKYEVLTLTKKFLPISDHPGNDEHQIVFLLEFADSLNATEAAEELRQNTCCDESLRTMILEKPFDAISARALTKKINRRRSKRQKIEP